MTSRYAPPESTDMPPVVQRVLVVDDDPAIVEIIGEILSLNDMNAVIIDNGEDAVDLLSNDKDFCGALIDLTMPTLSGIELLDRMRELDSDLPVVLMSGYSAQDTQEALAKRPRTAFLQKPFGVRALLNIINKMTRSETPRR